MNNIKEWCWDNFGESIKSFRQVLLYKKFFLIGSAIIILILTQFISSLAVPYKIYFQILLVFVVLIQSILSVFIGDSSVKNLEVFGKLMESEDNFQSEKENNDLLVSFLETVANTIDIVNQFIGKVHSLDKKSFSKDEIKIEVKKIIKLICKLLLENSELFYISKEQRDKYRLKVSIYMLNDEKNKLVPIYIASDIKSTYRQWDISEHSEESFVVKGFLHRKLFIVPDWESFIANVKPKNSQAYDKKTYRSVIVSPIIPKNLNYEVSSDADPIGIIAISSGEAHLWNKDDEKIGVFLEIFVQIIIVLWYNVIERYQLGRLDPISQEI